MTENTAPAPAGGFAKPTVRNALMTWLVPMLLFAAAPPLGNFLGQTAFRFAPTAAILAGTLLALAHIRKMVGELNAVTGNPFVWWHCAIPFYGIYWAAVLLPAEVADAKQKAGKGARRGVVVYLFVPLYALAAELNDIAR